jgi:undecaprenyl-diphosphatase
VVGWTTLGFGVVLFVADRLGMTFKRVEHLSAAGALAIGLAQVLALIPGTSRAGITMTAARALGFERQDAARFSMLLSIPTIAGAGILGGLDIYASGDPRLGLDALLAAVFACATALVAISLMMAWLRHATFTPFIIYRAILGIALLTWVYL